MIKKSVPNIFIALLLGFLLAGCSKSDDQRQFENEARSAPNQITETDANGNVISVDRDDWRIGPMFRGQIDINTELAEPPYPNPLLYNQDLNIQLHFRVENPVDQIEIYKSRFLSDSDLILLQSISWEELSRPVGYIPPIQGSRIASNPNSREEYRILIYDGQQNLITYGDVRIE